MELIFKNWHTKFTSELSKTKKLRVVSPFVKEQIIKQIYQTNSLEKFELITRFNLSDFVSGVSSLGGLQLAVQHGAEVYGVKKLHSKIYLFDSRAAIITSANLTTGGLVNNYECGVYITNTSLIQQLNGHFEELRDIGKNPLSISQCSEWQQSIEGMEIMNSTGLALPDYGGSKLQIDDTRNYYVKFLGTGSEREQLTWTSKEELDTAFCHYACCFASNRKPRQFKDGDVIYFARMIENPNDYAIFGKAEAIKFMDGRDVATEKELAKRPWKRDWPIYLRVQNPIFIDGTMASGIMLYDLISELDHESFASTKRRYEWGERNIVTKRVLNQKPYVKLSLEAVEWLEPKFQEALRRCGKVDEAFIDNLPKPEIKLTHASNKI